MAGSRGALGRGESGEILDPAGGGLGGALLGIFVGGVASAGNGVFIGIAVAVACHAAGAY